MRAWKNKASGFYANHSSGGNTWYNNTSFMNGTPAAPALAEEAADRRHQLLLTGWRAGSAWKRALKTSSPRPLATNVRAQCMSVANRLVKPVRKVR